MKSKMITVRTLLAIAVLGLAMAVPTVQAQRNRNPGVMPPQSQPNDKSYAEWAAAWWQWAFSIPKATSPLLDQTGEYAALGQTGPVWFLAGTSGGYAERTVTVPKGKMLFFPILNYCWINVPELGDNPWSPEQYALMRDFLAAAIDSAVDLSCAIDGRAVQNIQDYRCHTPENLAFMVDIPEGDIWDLVDVYGLEPGTYGPSADDGIYLMLTPLSPGRHTIHFTGGVGDFHLDVTYHLTVK
jgi:hypothetical protein